MAEKNNEDLSKELKDSYRTPDWFFGFFNRKYNFYLDVCASADNSKCPLYMDLAYDAFTNDWPLPNGESPWAWCNPPYSVGNIPKAIKAAERAQTRGIGTVMLIRTDMGNSYWPSMDVPNRVGVVIHCIKERLHFNHPVTNAGTKNARGGATILIFPPTAELQQTQTKYLDLGKLKKLLGVAK